MIEIEGFILLGGASSRMGIDKSRLDLGGVQFVERIAAALSRITTKVSIVGARDSKGAGQLPNVPDVYPKWGALGGVHAALASCESEWAVIVACDLPLVTEELFVKLAGFCDNVDAVVPIQDDGRLQPLCALYRRATCLPAAVELVESSERRPRILLEQVKTRMVTTNELSDLRDAELFFMNINTTEDYEKAQRAVINDK